MKSGEDKKESFLMLNGSENEVTDDDVEYLKME